MHYLCLIFAGRDISIAATPWGLGDADGTFGRRMVVGGRGLAGMRRERGMDAPRAARGTRPRNRVRSDHADQGLCDHLWRRVPIHRRRRDLDGGRPGHRRRHDLSAAARARRGTARQALHLRFLGAHLPLRRQRLDLFGQIHRAHATLAQQAQDAEGPDALGVLERGIRVAARNCGASWSRRFVDGRWR